MSFIAKGVNPEPSVAYRLRDSLVTFSLEQLLSLSLAFISIDTFGSYR